MKYKILNYAKFPQISSLFNLSASDFGQLF